MTTQREQLIQAWLTQVLESDQYQLNYLAGDASFRRYARVRLAEQDYMLMDAPPEKEDCSDFVRIDEFLDQHHVRVPHIHAKDLQQGLLLLEDFGDVLLSTLLTPEHVDDYYLQCFKQLVQLQNIPAQGQLPNYSQEKLLSELHLFSDWLLPALGLSLTDAQKSMLDVTNAFLVQAALTQPQVLVHRDFHSRNLMKIGDQLELGVIDFQDAVIGADTYDLISLTRDAYVQWPKARVETWFEQFYALLPSAAKQDRDLNQFKRDANLMAIQRHIKILGIFVRLFERDGKSGYLKDLPRVMWYLLQESEGIAELVDFRQFVLNDVMPKFEQKYGDYVEVVE